MSLCGPEEHMKLDGEWVRRWQVQCFDSWAIGERATESGVLQIRGRRDRNRSRATDTGGRL